MAQIVYLDFETYFDTKIKYDLKSISMTEYINDSRFKAFGCGVKFNNDDPFWVSANNLQTFFRSYKWADYILVAHNIKFDGAIAAWKYDVQPLEYRDTKSMAMAIYGDSVPSFSLKYLADKLGLVSKGMMKTNGLMDLTIEQERDLAEYCLTDVTICAELYKQLSPHIPPSQWPLIDWTIRAFIEPKLEINREMAKQVQQEIEERKKRLLMSCDLDKETLASNILFAGYLIEHNYTVPMKKNPKGKLIPALALSDPEFVAMTKSLDKNLRNIALARKEIKKTMEKKRAEKLQVLGKKYPFDVVFSGATQTHRFSGGNGAGGNPQNFPRESILRRCIEAPIGYHLLVGDFKNIEMRILAFLAREPKLIKAIRDKTDVYAEFAAKVFKISVNEIAANQRQFGKAAILGLGYNMGPKRFYKECQLQELEVSEQLAKETVYLYRDEYNYIPNFWKIADIVIQMMANGQRGLFPGVPFLQIKKDAIVLPSGLELKFPNLRKEEDEWIYDKFKSQVTKTDKIKLYGGKLTENICQALAGEICKNSIAVLCQKGIIPSGQVHDELLVVSTTEKRHNHAICVKTAMTLPPKWWTELKLDVDIGVGKNWYDAKRDKNYV